MDKCDALALHEAYVNGDLERIKYLLNDPPDFPNCRGPRGIGEIVLEYAIYHSFFAFIRTLLDLGADPNYGDHAGFPSLIAALSTDRDDRLHVVELLLFYGADIQQYGHNGYTPLHWAAAGDDVQAIELLIKNGADTTARTLVDDHNTPEEEAELLNCQQAVTALQESVRKDQD
ncbi:MAG: ankyrin repeat domain-containing protein [bacterium]|nr:ankyrin repeat domain-containing protein [bacterium]